jgi:hypothetical protein
MGMLRRIRSEDAPAELADDASAVLRDCEESLVAALQESDTAVEAIGDTGSDAGSARSRRRWTIGAAGLALAALGFMVARRRR